MCNQLKEYFSDGLRARSSNTIGIEVETSFLDRDSRSPISLSQSQDIFQYLTTAGWKLVVERGGLITALSSTRGDLLTYELGRQNLEISAAPGSTPRRAVEGVRMALDQLYDAARTVRAVPYFGPIVNTDEDLLVVPDKRDETWVRLDGRKALRPLATISSVQFTIEVSKKSAMTALNRLGAAIPEMLALYPQDGIWRTYIRESEAGYKSSRYGGPCQFESIDDYVSRLAEHEVVLNGTLQPQSPILDVSMFVRSVWWYFRLRRCNDRLCVEVRPIARSVDEDIASKLEYVLNLLSL